MEDNRYFLNQVLQRYDSGLQKRSGVFYGELHLNGLDKGFVFAVVNAFDESTFNAADFEPFSIEMIVDYIQRTHTFYLQKSLPEIKKTIFLLSKDYPADHPLIEILYDFFTGYHSALKSTLQMKKKSCYPISYCCETPKTLQNTCPSLC